MSNTESKDARIKKLARQIEKSAANLDDTTKILVESMAADYAWFSVTCDDLKDEIDKEGVEVDGLHGSKENPKVGILHKMTARKHEYFTKILTAIRRASNDDADSLEEFLRQ